MAGSRPPPRLGCSLAGPPLFLRVGRAQVPAAAGPRPQHRYESTRQAGFPPRQLGRTPASQSGQAGIPVGYAGAGHAGSCWQATFNPAKPASVPANVCVTEIS
jgi:hypothetical protein